MWLLASHTSGFAVERVFATTAREGTLLANMLPPGCELAVGPINVEGLGISDGQVYWAFSDGRPTMAMMKLCVAKKVSRVVSTKPLR